MIIEFPLYHIKPLYKNISPCHKFFYKYVQHAILQSKFSSVHNFIIHVFVQFKNVDQYECQLYVLVM